MVTRVASESGHEKWLRIGYMSGLRAFVTRVFSEGAANDPRAWPEERLLSWAEWWP